MQNIIANIKKIALGLAVMGLAIGFSAFTDKNSKAAENQLQEVLFFNTSGSPSTDPNDYIYDANGDCNPVGQACSAIWQHSGPLVSGVTHPNGEKVEEDQSGTYIPGN